MKKTYFNLPKQPTRYAPRMNSRRLRIGILNHNIAYRTDGEDGGDPDESDEMKAIAAIGKQVEQFKTALGDRAKKEDFDALKTQLETLSKNIADMQAADVAKSIDAINKANEKIWKQIVEMQEENARSKEEGEKGKAKKSRMMDIADVDKLIAGMFPGATKQGGRYVDGKKKTGEGGHSLEVMKAPENFGYANFFEGGNDTDVSAFTGRMIDPTLYQRKRKRNLILDNFNILTIDVPELVYLIKVEVGDSNPVSGDPGGAGWILPGAPKPKRSFRVTTGKALAKKIAIFGTVEDELLRDVASLDNWIRQDFTDEMREGINDGLLNNDPGIDPDAPLGLKTNAILYTATPAYVNTIPDPNYIDAIFAIVARMLYNKEEAGRIFVSSDVHTRIMHLKDNENRYQNNNLIYVNNIGQLFIGGVPIIIADEEDVPSTHVLVTGVDLGFKMYAYGGMVLETGLNGEDFRHDRTSYRGYQRFLSFIPENRENSVLYDTWQNIFAAIEGGS